MSQPHVGHAHASDASPERPNIDVAAASMLFGWVPVDEGACPSEAAITRAVEQDLPVHETRKLVDHLSACPGCFRFWRGARAKRLTALFEPDSIADLHGADS